MKNKLQKKIISGERITKDDAIDLFSWDILDLGRLADTRRRMTFPTEQVGFIIDRIINYTNICEAKCRFCAYHARAGLIDAYELTRDEIISKVGECVASGGTQVMLQGGLHPDHGLDYYIAMVRKVRDAFPSVYIHSFSPTEIIHFSRKSGTSVAQTLGLLKNAGLNSVPGASDILVDRVRNEACPHKITTDEWVSVMRALHENGMGSTATMTYGLGETLDERIEHLDVVRSVQDETGVLRAFIPWSFSPKNTGMSDIPQATGLDYLRIVAIARIYLDNVKYIAAGWLTEGLKLAQIALAMGANDMGGVLMEEVVVKATGVTTRTNMEELIDIIRNAGKVPVLRDSEYNVVRTF